MINKLRSYIILFFLFAVFIQASAASGEKILTFEDLKEIEKYTEADKPLPEGSPLLKGQFYFSDEMKKEILKDGSPRAKLAAAAQEEFGGTMEIKLLHSAFVNGGKDPLILGIMAHYCFNESTEGTVNEEICNDRRKLVRSLIQIAPVNVFPYFLLAILDNREGKNLAGKKNFKKGIETGKYASYLLPLFLEIRNTAIEYHYPQFTANQLALMGLVKYFRATLINELCQSENINNDLELFLNECVAMGGLMESQSKSLIEKLVGYSIQNYGLNGLASPESEIKLNALKQRKKKTSTDLEKLNSSQNKMSEKQWLKYYDIFARDGESAAIAWLSTNVDK